MTLFKLLTGAIFQSRLDEAEYFRADAEWVIEAAKLRDIETRELSRLKDSAFEKMKSGEELSERESRFVAACLVGDAYWAKPLAEWSPVIAKPLVYLAEPVTRRRWLKVCQKYADPEDLSKPSYSSPSDLKVDGRDPQSRTSGFKERAILGASVLDVEWLRYVLDSMNIDFSEEFFDKCVRESVRYFGFNEEISTEIEEFQKQQLRLAAVWTEEVIIDYHIRSYILDKADIALRESGGGLENSPIINT